MGQKTIAVAMGYAHLPSEHQLEAARRLCHTGSGLGSASETRTATGPAGQLTVEAARPDQVFALKVDSRKARMAKLADAADLKSVALRWVWGFKSPSGHQ